MIAQFNIEFSRRRIIIPTNCDMRDILDKASRCFATENASPFQGEFAKSRRDCKIAGAKVRLLTTPPPPDELSTRIPCLRFRERRWIFLIAAHRPGRLRCATDRNSHHFARSASRNSALCVTQGYKVLSAPISPIATAVKDRVLIIFLS